LFFFDANGNYKNTGGVDYFANLLFILYQDLFNNSYLSSESKNNYLYLLNSFVDLASENKHIEQVVEETVSNPTKIERVIDTTSRDLLDELKKYYKNGEIILVPENIEEFTRLLDGCQLDEREKKYILDLINQKKSKEECILKYLSEEDICLYEKALEVLNTINYSDKNYKILLENIENLKTAGLMLDELENNQMEYVKFKVAEAEILAEINKLLFYIRNILINYNKEEKIENNIVFLLDDDEVPFVQTDACNLDGSFFKMICAGIRKIRKDNQGNFNLIMTQEEMDYRVYDVVSSKTHIFFVQIDSGIYLVVGCDVCGHGYKDIIRRVINNGKKIKEIEELIKNNNTRSNILNNHEIYLELFNSAVVSLVRKKEVDNE